MKIRLISIWILMFLFGLAGNAAAHKTIVFSWVEDNAIRVEASFGAKRPALKSQVTVKRPDGEIVFQGVTDEKGFCSFPLSQPVDSDLTVEVDAGTGHRGEWTLSSQEINEALAVESSADQENAQAYVDEKHAQRDELEKGPSPVKILLGIVVICLMAFGANKIRAAAK